MRRTNLEEQDNGEEEKKKEEEAEKKEVEQMETVVLEGAENDHTPQTMYSDGAMYSTEADFSSAW